MEQNFNIGAMKAEAMRKAFGIDIEKGRTGVYEDNAENRRLNRVGQPYGHKKEEEMPRGRQTAKQEETAGDKGGAVAEATPVAKHAEGASDEALKRAAADPKALPEVKAAAKAEMKKRGSGEGAETVKKDNSSRGKVLKDFKSVSSSELWNAGYDSGDAKEIYLKSSGDKDEVVLVQEDDSVIYSVVDSDGEEDFKRFKTFDEFEKHLEKSGGAVKKDMKPKELVSAIEDELDELMNKEGVHNDSPEWRKGAYEIWKKYKEAYPNFSKLKTAKNFDGWFTGSHQGAAQGIKMKAYLKARDAGKTHEEGEKAAQDEYDAVMRYINRR